MDMEVGITDKYNKTRHSHITGGDGRVSILKVTVGRVHYTYSTKDIHSLKTQMRNQNTAAIVNL